MPPRKQPPRQDPPLQELPFAKVLPHHGLGPVVLYQYLTLEPSRDAPAKLQALPAKRHALQDCHPLLYDMSQLTVQTRLPKPATAVCKLTDHYHTPNMLMMPRPFQTSLLQTLAVCTSERRQRATEDAASGLRWCP